MRRAIARALLGGAAAVMLAAAGPSLPVKSVFAGADPYAIFADGKMWIYPTGDDRLPAWSSPDRVNWTKVGDLIRMKDISWANADGAPRHFLWAPDMFAANGKYYLYYSVGPQNPTPSRLGVAICEGPAGPCADSGKPLLTGGNGFEAIDPMVFADPKSGKTYLYAGGSAGAKLRVFELAKDLVTIDHEVTVDQPPLFTEGVFMHERNGIYYLSYSHGHWDDASYAVYYAMATSPTGPWKYRGILLQSDKKFKGPGHHAFVQDPADGQWYIVYHRWEGEGGNGPYHGDRRVAIQPISYDQYGQIEPVKMSE